MSTPIALAAVAALAAAVEISKRGSRSVLPPEIPQHLRRRLSLALSHGARMKRFRDAPSAYHSYRSYIEELQEFVEVPDEWVLVGEIPTEVAKSEVMRSLIEGSEREGEEPRWICFDHYHAWYANVTPVPDYPFEGRWPSQLMLEDDEDFFWDGWHRFHSYVRSGHPTVPYYTPLDRSVGDALHRAGIGQ